MKLKHKLTKYSTFVIYILLSIFVFLLYQSYHGIKSSYYQLGNEKINKSVRLVIVSDLHSHDWRKGNAELIEKILFQNPDAILMVGDMLNKDSENPQQITDLIESLVDTAPIYYAMGNHELEWQEFYQEDLQTQLEDAGAVVLNESYMDIDLNGQVVRIGGIYNYAFGFDKVDFNDVSDPKVQTYNFLTDFQNTDVYKIMLSHRPDSFIFSDASKTWDIDLVVSGHLHGGQVVLPFLGGIYGGDQGNFPKYVHGLYEKDSMNILITSGLGTNKSAVPRWNNPPEIMVLELTAK